MMVGLPVVVFLLPVAWIWLTRHVKDAQVVSLPNQGPWRHSEIRTLFTSDWPPFRMTRQNPEGGWAWTGLGKCPR